MRVGCRACASPASVLIGALQGEQGHSQQAATAHKHTSLRHVLEAWVLLTQRAAAAHPCWPRSVGHQAHCLHTALSRHLMAHVSAVSAVARGSMVGPLVKLLGVLVNWSQTELDGSTDDGDGDDGEDEADCFRAQGNRNGREGGSHGQTFSNKL